MINPNIAVTIGVIGGGQLGKMMAMSAKRQGYSVVVLDPQENCPASQVCDDHIVATYHDATALKQLADCATVVTYEFENVDCKTILEVIPKEKFPQGVQTLEISQNRVLEKEFLQTNGLPVGDYAVVTHVDALDEAVARIGYPCVLKTTRFGYDGKGQVVLRSESDKQSASMLLAQQPCVLEAFITFEKEVSMMISRNTLGEVSIFPVSENVHKNNILHTSVVPARISEDLAERIKEYTITIAHALDLVGTLGIEYFVCDNGVVYVNEMAPRPHNSGHYSIEACNFSQFDVSIQSVLGLPMPTILLHQPVVMVNVLGQHQDGIIALKNNESNWHFHDYGKLESQVNRKMGHVTILTQDVSSTLLKIESSNIW